MAVENQDFANDPIVDALGITLDAHPVIPPVDVVRGHFQSDAPNFRLYLENWGMYMQTTLDRIKMKVTLPSQMMSVLVLRADGNYEDDVIIGYTRRPGEEAFTPSQPTHMMLYKAYEYPKTTPWHE